MSKQIMFIILTVLLFALVYSSRIYPLEASSGEERQQINSGSTVLISVFDNGKQVRTNGFSAISADGKHVVFSTWDDYLEKGDNNGGRLDLYVYDVETLETSLVSVGLDGLSPENGVGARRPGISGDGRYVTYCSDSPDIVANDTNGVADCFVYDRLTKVTERVSVGHAGVEANGSSSEVAMSDDGQIVAFWSIAKNLVSNDTNGYPDVFVHNRVTKETKRVSVYSGGGEADEGGTLMSLSGNGRYVLFFSESDNIITGVISAMYIHDRETNITAIAAYDRAGTPLKAPGSWGSSYARPLISGDGDFLLVETKDANVVENDLNGETDVFRYDRNSGLPTRVSVNSEGAELEEESRWGTISTDGQHVAFVTRAAVLPEDTNDFQDVYIHHLETKTFELVAINPDGIHVSSGSSNASISSDASSTVFHSGASDLVPGDIDNNVSIFLRRSASGAIPLHTPSVDPIENSDDDGTFVVRWSNVVNASQYELHEIGISGAGQQIYVGPGRSYTVTDKGYGTWCYKVRALGPNESQSEWSTLSCIEIPPCVPYFSQEDPRWASHPLRTDGRCDAVCNTIGACGCTLTAATMLFAYYGADLTPNTLSDAMGTQACPFVWGAGAAATGGKATNPLVADFTWQRLEKELNENRRPVILKMTKWWEHWVLVTSGQGEDPASYLIHDPWPKNGPDTSLDVYRKQGWSFNSLVTYAGVGVCKPAPTTALHINLTNNLRKEIEPNAASIGSLALSRGNKTEQDSITGSISVYHLNVDTVVVQLQALSENAAIIEMQVWTDSQANPQWQPYDVLAWVPWEAEDDMVYARFRDKEGNTSQVVQDSMWPLIGPPSETDPEPRVLNLLPLILNR